MTESTFNPAEAVTFDLAYGHVHLDGAPTRVLLPADAVMALCEGAGQEATAALGHAMGSAMGRRVAVRLAPASDERQGDVLRREVDEVVEQLAAEFALSGVGALGAERWGRALILVHDQSPFGEKGDGLIAELLQAALASLTDKAARLVRLERNGVRVRYLVVSPAVVERVRARLDAGSNWGELLAQLHHDGPNV